MSAVCSSGFGIAALAGDKTRAITFNKEPSLKGFLWDNRIGRKLTAKD